MWQKMLQVGSGGGGKELEKLIFRRFGATPSASWKNIGTVEGNIKYVIGLSSYVYGSNTFDMYFLYDVEHNSRYRYYARYSGDEAYTEIADTVTEQQTFQITNDGKTAQVKASSTAYQRSTVYIVMYEAS